MIMPDFPARPDSLNPHWGDLPGALSSRRVQDGAWELQISVGAGCKAQFARLFHREGGACGYAETHWSGRSVLGGER